VKECKRASARRVLLHSLHNASPTLTASFLSALSTSTLLASHLFTRIPYEFLTQSLQDPFPFSVNALSFLTNLTGHNIAYRISAVPYETIRSETSGDCARMAAFSYYGMSSLHPARLKGFIPTTSSLGSNAIPNTVLVGALGPTILCIMIDRYTEGRILMAG
jgi:hypothetical protein